MISLSCLNHFFALPNFLTVESFLTLWQFIFHLECLSSCFCCCCFFYQSIYQVWFVHDRVVYLILCLIFRACFSTIYFYQVVTAFPQLLHAFRLYLHHYMDNWFLSGHCKLVFTTHLYYRSSSCGIDSHVVEVLSFV